MATPAGLPEGWYVLAGSSAIRVDRANLERLIQSGKLHLGSQVSRGSPEPWTPIAGTELGASLVDYVVGDHLWQLLSVSGPVPADVKRLAPLAQDREAFDKARVRNPVGARWTPISQTPLARLYPPSLAPRPRTPSLAMRRATEALFWLPVGFAVVFPIVMFGATRGTDAEGRPAFLGECSLETGTIPETGIYELLPALVAIAGLVALIGVIAVPRVPSPRMLLASLAVFVSGLVAWFPVWNAAQQAQCD